MLGERKPNNPKQKTTSGGKRSRIATPDRHTDMCVSVSMVFMFRLLIMHASMPRPKLAATHSSHCFAAVFFRCRWGGGVFGHRAVGGRELNGFISQNGVRPTVDESVGRCKDEVWTFTLCFT